MAGEFMPDGSFRGDPAANADRHACRWPGLRSD
jgi:hypothetical protein